MKNSILISITFLLGVILQNNAIATTTALINADAVMLFANPTHTQNINLLNTLGDTYIGVQKWQHNESVMLGLGLRSYQSRVIHVNTSIQYLPNINTTAQGDILQLHSPRFHNLTYTYDISSRFLFIDNAVIWTVHRLQPGFIIGIGGASNTAQNYNETALNNHTIAALSHFSNNTQTQFAYELGAVLDYPLKNIIIQCAYRYMNAGQGQLGLSPLQNTAEHLSTGVLHYHAISLGVRFEHNF